MQRVITVVRSTLQDLQLAIEGSIIMSEVGLLGTAPSQPLMSFLISLLLGSFWKGGGGGGGG